MAKVEELKPPPHDDVLEQTVLGAILARHRQASELLDLVREDDFFHPDHKKIFKIMQQLVEKGTQPDLVSVYDEIGRIGDLEGKSLFECLGNLGNDVHKAGDVVYAGRRLRELSVTLKVLRLTDNIKTLAQRGAGKPTQLIEGAIDQLSAMAMDLVDLEDEGVSHFNASASALLEASGDAGPKIYTDIQEVDNKIGGLRKGEVCVIAAPTGVGKTLLAQQIRARACRDGYHSLYCSGEMFAAHLKKRELAAAADVPPLKMRFEHLLTEDDMRALLEAAGRECRKCRILDGELSLFRIRRAARKINAGDGLNLIILDYDELIDAPGKDETEQMKNLIRASVTLARETKCPVVLISQFRKRNSTESVENPTLDWLFSSGSKSKFAHVILYVDRPYVRNLEGDETEATVFIMKSRDGRIGPVKARFNIHKLRFEDVPKQEREVWHDRTEPHGEEG